MWWDNNKFGNVWDSWVQLWHYLWHHHHQVSPSINWQWCVCYFRCLSYAQAGKKWIHLAFLGTFQASFQEKIEWKYISALHQVQQHEGLKLANKISTEHVQFEKHKMNVSLAAQTLSSSVAEAIEFLDKVLKTSEFEGSAGTVKFIKIIDRLFDILNSRNPMEKDSNNH